jgi:two-component system, OmpR family, response regulator CpxR
MLSISIFNGAFCLEESVIEGLVERTGCGEVTDADIVSEASKISQISPDNIRRAFSSKVSVFNKFTHEREIAIAYMKLTMAEKFPHDDFIYTGFSGLLIPKNIEHVLRVCLIADMKFRLGVAEKQGIPLGEARRQIRSEDENRAAWVEAIEGSKDPWDSGLFDITVPMDKNSVEDALELICRYADSGSVDYNTRSRMAAEDFRLSARVEVALAKEGHVVGVETHDGIVTLTINKRVLMLSRLEEELQDIVMAVDGVNEIKTKVGANFHQADIYRKVDFMAPAKVLLVDDEREFVQTMSERLLMRDMGSTVAYDGESALSLVNEEEPEVMILDLKMPGIDGIEVLRRVKATRRDIEVIILTGHGTEEDKDTCMKLGAFAYLRKPVDIDLLSETLKRAHEKVSSLKDGGSAESQI